MGCAADDIDEPTNSEEELTVDWTDHSIVDPTLARMSPTAYVDPTTQTSMELYAVAKTGLVERQWNASTGAWSCGWRQFGYDSANGLPAPTQLTDHGPFNPGWDAGLSVLPLGSSRRQVAFSFQRGGNGTGLSLNSLDLAAGTRTSSVVGFATGLGWMSAQAGLVDHGTPYIYGFGAVDGDPVSYYAGVNLPLQVFGGGQATSAFANPAPGNAQMAVGPGSAVEQANQAFVFATSHIYANPEDLLSGDVFALSSSTTGWTDLGLPSNSISAQLLFGAPLAVGLSTDSSGQGPINVYVTGRAKYPSQDYKLYERVISNGDLGTGAWKLNDAQPNVPPGTKFRMTTALVWWEGQKYQSQLRINMFGYTESSEAQPIPQVVEVFYDGSGWHPGMVLTSPDGGGLRVTSSAVIDTPSLKRLGVFVRSSTGRIYELAYTIKNGVQTGWTWTNLSLLQACPFK
jgi:hypothetical protein